MSSSTPSPVLSVEPPTVLGDSRRPGGPVGALLGRPAFWIVAVALLFGVPLGRSLVRHVPPAPPVLGRVPTFHLVDQTGAPFGSPDLDGKTWVANFIFTSCPTACPVLSQRMAEIARRGRELGPDLHLVSFSVDPGRDTPPVLAAYAARYGADPQKWTFLTGPTDAIQSAVVDGFKIGLGKEKNADGFWTIFHGEHFVLVDRHQRIRGYFDATADGMNRLMESAGLVANETP